MWASAAAPPLKPSLPNAISAAEPPSRCRSVFVYCHRNREETTALKSEEPRRQNAAQLETKGKAPEATREKKLELHEQRQFSGVDVLMALQKATPRKVRKKNNREISAVSEDVCGAGRDNQVATKLRNLRSLRIKSEWSGRLDQLERRLSELARR